MLTSLSPNRLMALITKGKAACNPTSFFQSSGWQAEGKLGREKRRGQEGTIVRRLWGAAGQRQGCVTSTARSLGSRRIRKPHPAPMAPFDSPLLNHSFTHCWEPHLPRRPGSGGRAFAFLMLCLWCARHPQLLAWLTWPPTLAARGVPFFCQCL